MKELNSALLYLENQFIVKLDLPELRIEKGVVFIDCYIDKSFFGEDIEKTFLNNKNYFDDKTYSINALESNGSNLIFNQVYRQSESYPSYKFSFLCYDYYTQFINTKDTKDIFTSKLKYIVIEGIDMQFTKTTETRIIRTIFGKDDSRMLSFELDNSEINYSYYSKKRSFILEIGLIKDRENEKSVIISFFQEDLIPFHLYHKIKHSLKYFISYLCGNNIVIREEYYQNNYQHFTRIYSQRELTEYNVNHFLPIHDVHFRHENIINDYVKTISNFFIWDKILGLSEIVYLINQSKQVNIESSFFILLIVIEKIANSLYISDVINKNETLILDVEQFRDLKQDLYQLIESNLQGNASSKKIEQLKSKVGNINKSSKTDNKIDILLDFCEIKRTEEIDQLFPKLRNLAIHQGEISYDKKDSSKNYHTLFILVNSIICNLIQYKGIRFIEHKDKTNYISKKEEYKFDIENCN
ncbi:hypothetical protein [Flavobacterium microcysteis]